MIGNALTPVDQAVLNKSRLDKFVLVFDVPPLLREANKKFERSNDFVQSDSIQFAVYGTVIPRVEVPAVAANYGGSVMHVSSQARPGYPPVAVNFTIDNQFNNYWVIYTWLNALRSAQDGMYKTAIHQENRFSNNMLIRDYATDITIYAKDEYNVDIIKWTYKMAFPTNLGEISYSYRNAGEIETSFDFVFTEMVCELL